MVYFYCMIINCTRNEVKVTLGNFGCYRDIVTLSAGEKYILGLDTDETYLESTKLVVGSVALDHLISAHDLEDWSEIRIQEGPDGAFNWVGTKSQPSNKTKIVAAHESANAIFWKFDEALRSCKDLEQLYGRVKICRHQCKHLLQTYKEGIQKMQQLYFALIQDDKQTVRLYVDYRLTKLENSLDSLGYVVCAAKDLIGSCAGKLVKVALVVSIRRPSVEKDMEVFSEFDLLIRELEWHLAVIEYLIGASGDAKFVWSPTMCRYVLTQKKALDQMKPRNFARMDREELQSGLQDGSIDIPNTTVRDIILKRCEAQDPRSRPMDLVALEVDHLDLDLQHTRPDGELGKGKFKKLGGGSAKQVYEGNWHGQSVAVATIYLGKYDLDVSDRSPKSPTPSEKSRKAASEKFRKEVKGLLQLQHPKVVSLFGWAETTDAPAPIKEPDEKHYSVHGGYIVTEKMKCSLDKLIQMRRGDTSRSNSGPFSYSVGIDILLQIVEAMLHVHKHRVMHRDLKPGNFLVNPRSSPARLGTDRYYNVKLIDFGSSKEFVREDENTCNVGTAGYGDPDMMKKARRGKYGMSVDVYSFAMTCYEVVTGKYPFDGVRAEEIEEKVKRGIRPDLPEALSKDLKNLIAKCWHQDPEQRPSFQDICYVLKVKAVNLSQVQKLLGFLCLGEDRVAHDPARSQDWSEVLQVGRGTKAIQDDDTGAAKDLPHCLKIKPSDLKPLHELGKGSSAEVFEANWIGCRFAVKWLRVKHVVKLRNEVNILMKLLHPHVIRLVGFSVLETRCAIVMELLDMSLLNLMENRTKDSKHATPFSEAEALAIIRKLALGMNFLHSRGVAHRDLRPANVLVRYEHLKAGMDVKIVDFGLSRLLGESGSEKISVLGRYRAPEVILSMESREHVDIDPKAADVYSFAMVCYEVITGKKPFFDCDSDTAAGAVAKGGGMPKVHGSLQARRDLWQLLQRCWSEDPQARPKFDEVVKELDCLCRS